MFFEIVFVDYFNNIFVFLYSFHRSRILKVQFKTTDTIYSNKLIKQYLVKKLNIGITLSYIKKNFISIRFFTNYKD